MIIYDFDYKLGRIWRGKRITITAIINQHTYYHSSILQCECQEDIARNDKICIG
jgi:hypothetical protein